MIARDTYLDISLDDHGVKVLSRHPHTQHHRFIRLEVADGRASVNWDYADHQNAEDATGRMPFVDATPLFAIHGYREGADAILEALNYPRDGRSHAAGFLIQALPEIAPLQLLSIVDRRAIEALRAVSAPSLLNLEFYSGDGERSSRRRQAASSMPPLAGILANNITLKMTIDRSKPLTDGLIDFLGSRTTGSIGKGAIRRFSGVTDKPYGTDIDTVIEFASRIPADWIPTGEDEWKIFCMIGDGVINRLRLSAAETTTFLKGCSGRWQAFASRMVAPLSEQERGEGLEVSIPVAFGQLRDVMECLVNIVVLPMAVHGKFASKVTVNTEVKQYAFALAKRMLLGEKSAPALIELSRKWHTQRAVILDATRLAEQENRVSLLGEIPHDGWPPLCDPVVAPNGLVIVPLNSPDQLQWESSKAKDPTGAPGLSHCVWSYPTKCLSGESHIVSIREFDENGAYSRISTVEFARLHPTSNRLTVVQNQGFGNSTPSGQSRDAVTWFTEAVALGQIPLKRDLMQAFERDVLGEMDGVERQCGYDWRDGELLRRAIAPWGPYIDRKYRELGLKEFHALDDFSPIREAIVPDLIRTDAGIRP